MPYKDPATRAKKQREYIRKYAMSEKGKLTAIRKRARLRARMAADGVFAAKIRTQNRARDKLRRRGDRYAKYKISPSSRAAYRRADQKYKESLGRGYIASRLKLKSELIPPEWIEIKRISIRIHRLLMKNKQGESWPSKIQ